MPDELDKLFVSNEELDKNILFKILYNRVKITEENDVLIMGKFPPTEKILLYSLSKKVMFIKNKTDSEFIGPKEITEKTGLPGGTSKVYVRKLESEGLLLRKNGKYYIPNFSLIKIKEFFENDKNK